MELWIRSQDKKHLLRSECLTISGENDKFYICDTFIGHIATYKTEKRALEVLDEIQDKIKSSFLLKQKNILLDTKKCADAKKYFEELNDINCIVNDSCFDLEPINPNIIIYEMPEDDLSV